MKKILAVIALVLLPSLSWGVMMPPMYGAGNVMTGTTADPINLNGPIDLTGPLQITGKFKLGVGGSIWMATPATSVLTGSINPTASTSLVGVGTLFTTETMPGDKLLISGETVTIVTIIDDTHATCTPATTDTANDASVDRYPVGLSIAGSDTSVATDLRIYPAVKSSGNLIDVGVGTTSKFNVTAAGSVYADATLSNSGRFINYRGTSTCNAGAGVAALTITPGTAYIEITNSDADGCNITMGETNIEVGTVVTMCVISNAGTTVNFADTPGVTELAGAFAADVDDCIVLRYGNTTTWREISRSAN